MNWTVNVTDGVKCACSTKLLQSVSNDTDFTILELEVGLMIRDIVRVCFVNDSHCEISSACSSLDVPGCVIDTYCGKPNNMCAIFYGDLCPKLKSLCENLPGTYIYILIYMCIDTYINISGKK